MVQAADVDFRHAHGFVQAGRLPLLEPSRLPPGSELFVFPSCEESLLPRCPRKLRVRQIGMQGSQI